MIPSNLVFILFNETKSHLAIAKDANACSISAGLIYIRFHPKSERERTTPTSVRILGR